MEAQKRVECCSRLSVLPRSGELYLSSRVHKPPERPRSASSTRGAPQDQAHIFRENEENNTAEEISWPWSLNKHACNTSDLRSKLKLVNTLKRKVFKKKRISPLLLFTSVLMLFQECQEQLPKDGANS